MARILKVVFMGLILGSIAYAAANYEAVTREYLIKFGYVPAKKISCRKNSNKNTYCISGSEVIHFNSQGKFSNITVMENFYGVKSKFTIEQKLSGWKNLAVTFLKPLPKGHSWKLNSVEAVGDESINPGSFIPGDGGLIGYLSKQKVMVPREFTTLCWLINIGGDAIAVDAANGKIVHYQYAEMGSYYSFDSKGNILFK